MNEARPLICFFSGMGADSRLLAPQLKAFPGSKAIEWQRPRDGESVGEYAFRISAQFPPGEVVVGGISFGGVIAQEVARQRPCLGVVLISSLQSPSELPSIFQVGRRMPMSWLRSVASLFSAAPTVARATHVQPRRLILRMLAEADPVFLRWAMAVLVNWEPHSMDAVPLLRIHGRRDLLIRPTSSAPVEWIKGGGHLSNLTHADAVNNAIAAFLRSL